MSIFKEIFMNLMSILKSFLAIIDIYDNKTKDTYFFASGRSVVFAQP